LRTRVSLMSSRSAIELPVREEHRTGFEPAPDDLARGRSIRR
jgi:hypothetical protein